MVRKSKSNRPLSNRASGKHWRREIVKPFGGACGSLPTPVKSAEWAAIGRVSENADSIFKGNRAGRGGGTFGGGRPGGHDTLRSRDLGARVRSSLNKLVCTVEREREQKTLSPLSKDFIIGDHAKLPSRDDLNCGPMHSERRNRDKRSAAFVHRASVSLTEPFPVGFGEVVLFRRISVSATLFYLELVVTEEVFVGRFPHETTSSSKGVP